MLHKRIREVRTLLKMSQKDFGDKLGVSRDVIANIEYNRAKPQKIFIQHLCSTFNVNQDWLETGEGSVFINDKRSKNLSEAIRIFESLNPDLQDYALKQIKAFLELQEKKSPPSP
ncbi:helix-turn-helix domain-containing protein [Clostridium thermosuccinogenes]|uniref:helix-turn-helix domain-containing protein n=1 Tax=Clostridium thermosuccinogenes TaxID=84032 RepID=UPI00192DE577|nr:helix-turn-helix transcriptional regulator [Pseudoclostridium thermosuccinogenes]